MKHALALPLFACMLLASLTACGHQQQITFYAPDESLQIDVSSSGGPANQASFTRANGEIRMMVVVQPSYNPARIWLSIHLPEGHTLRFTDENFILASTEDAHLTRNEKIAYIRATRDQNGETITEAYNINQTIQGQSFETITRFMGKHTTVPRHIEIVSYIDGNLPHKFNLTLPEMEISGEKADLPVITFTRTEGMHTVPQEWNHYPW